MLSCIISNQKTSELLLSIIFRTREYKLPINKIALNDAYRQYLNYYLGQTAYANKAYKTDKKAIIFAKSVEKQSKIYKNQLKECQKSLDRKKYIIF